MTCPVCTRPAPTCELVCYHMCETCLMNTPYSKETRIDRSFRRQDELRGATMRLRNNKNVPDETNNASQN